jgi:tetratricopeptide (TPR) repeat protein
MATLDDSRVGVAVARDVGVARGTAVGRYLVLGRLGAGGMGIVYEAWDPELDRRVALKLLHAVDDEDSRASAGRARLLREAQAMARLSHPNVLVVHDVGTHQGRVFVAMELIEGGTLTTWLREHARPWRQILATLVAAGRGVAAAHAAGLVHRDLKPENVLVGRDGRVLVGDFGLARPAEPSAETTPGLPSVSGSALSLQLTRTGAAVGTPAYMAPEQHLGQAVDARTDQFSFCVACWEALYGDRPFSGGSLSELACNVIEGRPVAVPRGSRVPVRIGRALARGLSREPAERWPDMDSLLRELGRDPAAMQRRLGVAAGLASLAALIAWSGARLGAGHGLCERADDRVLAVWSPERAAAIESAFAATGLPFAAEAARGVTTELDVRVAAWKATYVDACEATHVRGEQSAELLDRRMACLGEQLERIDAMIGVFARADATTVERATSAVTELPPLERCADTRALLAATKSPDDPATRDAAGRARAQVGEAAALRLAGRYREGIPVVRAALETARSAGRREIEAEALVELGELELLAGEHAAARADLDEAVRVGLAGHRDEISARAWIALVALLGDELREREPAHFAAAHAHALVERLGGDPALLAELLEREAAMLSREGDAQAALDLARRAIELHEQHRGPRHLRVAAALQLAGQIERTLGRYDEALADQQRAVDLRAELLGPDHPDVARGLSNLGNVLWQKGDLEAAREHHERALVALESALGPDHPHVARAAGNLGNAYLELGRLEEAGVQYERALAVLRAGLGDAHPSVALMLDSLALVRAREQRHAEAVDLHRRALAAYEASLGPDHPDLGATLNNLAEALTEVDREEEATALLHRSIAVYERAFGPEHPELAPTLVNLGNSLHRAGRHADALAQFERALAIEEKALGSDHRFLAFDLLGIGRARIELGRPADAIAPLERALALRALDPGQRQQLPEVRFQLARALWAGGGDRDRARHEAQQSQDDWQRLGEHAQAAEVARWLARAR